MKASARAAGCAPPSGCRPGAHWPRATTLRSCPAHGGPRPPELPNSHTPTTDLMKKTLNVEKLRKNKGSSSKKKTSSPSSQRKKQDDLAQRWASSRRAPGGHAPRLPLLLCGHRNKNMCAAEHPVLRPLKKPMTPGIKKRQWPASTGSRRRAAARGPHEQSQNTPSMDSLAHCAASEKNTPGLYDC